MPFEKLTAWLRELEKNQNRIVRAAVEENQGVIVKLNKEQLDEGVYTDGEKITPEYTAFTKRIKRRIGQPSDRVTLKNTGKFRRQMNLATYSNRFQIFSKDAKAEKLKKKYAKQKDFFGLTQESKKALKRKGFVKSLQKHIRKI